MTRAQFYTYQEQTFDSFTKTVIKHKSIDIIREYARQAEHEIPLSDMSPSDLSVQASTTDIYRPYSKTYSVRNYLVRVHDPVIGELLQYLTPQRREVILMYYFLDLNDAEIGRLLHIDNTTAKYRRSSALKRLKKMMEDIENG
jgi:RNA polymerase sigma factor (sigma-70 family)